MIKRSALAVLLVLGIATAGCSGPSEVVIGAILSLEGSAATYGNSLSRGVELAVDQINAAGGIDVEQGGVRVPLRVELRDAKSDPQIGLQVAQELLAMGVPAVIGSDSSDVTLAIADLFQQSGVVLLSPSSSSPQLNDKGSFIYRNFPSDDLEAVNTANYIYNVVGIHDVDIMSSQSEFGLGIKNAFIGRFRMLGGSVETQVSFPAEAADVSAQAQDLVASEGGGIYIAGYSRETATAALALRAAGVDLPLFGTGAILADELVAAGGEAVEGLVFPTVTFDPDSDDETVRTFMQAYRTKFGEGADVYAAHGYDAMLILAQAIEQNGLRPDNIAFYLNAMNPFPGAAGETTFDEDGNARKFHRMFQIQGGQAVSVGQ